MCFRRTSPINDSSLAGSAKILRSDITCSYWLSKRNRHCLTKSVDGETYCQVHLDVIRSSELSVGDSGLQVRLNESKVHVDVERPSPTPGRCQFWLPKKKRYCKLLTSVEGKFCVEHSVATEVNFRLHSQSDCIHLSVFPPLLLWLHILMVYHAS
jgi:CCCH zinc finger in TRM13 protein